VASAWFAATLIILIRYKTGNYKIFLQKSPKNRHLLLPFLQKLLKIFLAFAEITKKNTPFGKNLQKLLKPL
jgi:hypothetical protein